MSDDNHDTFDSPTINNPYPNEEAHKHLKRLMLYQKKITITFKLDEYNFFATEIACREVQKFTYQVDSTAIGMLLDYITTGNFNDSKVNPLNPLFEEGNNKSNEVNKQVFSLLLTYHYVPHIKPRFIDKPGQLTATFKGKYGTMILVMQRNEETDKLMLQHELL